MAALVLRRLAGMIGVLLGVSVITFVIAQLVPTDVARLVAGDHASPAIIARVRAELGLDRPIWVQYGLYLDRLVHGDLGTSIRSGRAISDELMERLPATIELAFASFALIVAAGLSLGVAAALGARRWPDHLIRTISTIAISAPTFWTGVLLLAIFFGWLGWLPPGGRIDPDLLGEPGLTGLYIIDGLIAGRLDIVGSALLHLALPAITLALASSGSAIRLVRASMLDVLQEDYVRRARAAGLSEATVVLRYALPSALVPFVTAMALYLADLLAGAVVTEIIFGWPGLGSYTLEAIAGLDFPAIMGFTLLAAVFYTIANQLVDLIYGLLDPRLRPGART
ncbi:ABC transporter permease [Sphingomonas sp. 28-62-20]|uniref:ABC transporter permease n=1 Tax=Sphingomonas sp. 28-62-20 TaxID=1970433 RepID=UPI0035A8E278